MTIIELQSLGPSLWLWSFATPDNICSLVPPQSALCLRVRSEARTSEQFIIFCCPRPGPSRAPAAPPPSVNDSYILAEGMNYFMAEYFIVGARKCRAGDWGLWRLEDGASVAPDICKLGLVPLECELNATFATSTSNQSLSFENHLSTHFQQKEVF